VSDFNPIPRLQQIAATIEDGGHFDSPATAAHYINCAIKEIEQLRAERDEARREVLLWVKERCSWRELSQEIKKRKWEYLKEDGK
jgi:hypothetical protein